MRTQSNNLQISGHAQTASNSSFIVTIFYHVEGKQEQFQLMLFLKYNYVLMSNYFFNVFFNNFVFIFTFIYFVFNYFINVYSNVIALRVSTFLITIQLWAKPSPMLS